MKYEAWKGSFIDHYFGRLEKGEWVEISRFKYWFLSSRGYTVRKSK